MSELKQTYKEIEANLRSQMSIKLDIKDIEEDIKYDYAAEKQMTNKKGEIDPKLVKIAEVKSAMDIFFKLKDKDSLGEKYETREFYLKDMKQGEENFPIAKCKSHIQKQDNMKAAKDDLKDLESAKTSEEGEIGSEEFKALIEIAKIVIKKEEDIEKIKRAEARGEEINVADKEHKKFELETLKQKLAKQLGIEL